MNEPVPLFCPRCVLPIEAPLCPRCGTEGVFTGKGVDASKPWNLLGSCIEERYRIEREIRRGGMGEVYEATDLRLGRAVAVKVLRPDVHQGLLWHKRFMREARITAELSHPNCIRLYDFGFTRHDLPYMVIELLTGEDLWSIVHRDGFLPAAQALSWTGQILDGLQGAHALGIVHRDLKASNVFVTRHGQKDVLKILDFGVACQRTGPELERLTRTGVAVGTPAYMSPELAMGREIDARADIYAAGVVLYEMLTGVPPFEAPTVFELLRMHIEARPPRLAHRRPELFNGATIQAMLDRWLAKDPDERPATAAEARMELAAVRSAFEGRSGRGRKFDATALLASPPPMPGSGRLSRSPRHVMQPDVDAETCAEIATADLSARDPGKGEDDTEPGSVELDGRPKTAGPRPAVARLEVTLDLTGPDGGREPRVRLWVGRANERGKPRWLEVPGVRGSGRRWRGDLDLPGHTSEGVEVRVEVRGASGCGWRLRVYCDRPRRHLVHSDGGEIGSDRHRFTRICQA